MVKPVDYKQGDYRWGGLPYAVDGEKSTIKSAGCGPTSLADVLAAIVSPYIDPITLASWARQHGYKVKASGTAYSFFVPCAAWYGVNVRRLTASNSYGNAKAPVHEIVRQELINGNWVIACMGPGVWTKGGHYIVAYGYKEGNVYINDPASTADKRACNSFTTFSSQVKQYWVVDVPDAVKNCGICKDGEYYKEDFVREVQLCTGSKLDGDPGPLTLSKTVTVSSTKNRKHYVVMPLQKLLKKKGMYTGELDKSAGPLFTSAVNKYQTDVLRYIKLDGEITAKGKMWRSLLGLV